MQKPQAMLNTARQLWDDPEFWRKRVDEQLVYIQEVIINPSLSTARKEELCSCAVKVKELCIMRGMQAIAKKNGGFVTPEYVHIKYAE